MKEEIKVNDNELKILTAMAESYDSSGWDETGYFCFNSLSNITKLDRKQVRRACRSLKKKGLAKFLTGLITGEGEFAGAGYGATEEGASFISHCDNCKKLTHYEYNIDIKTGKQTYLSEEDEGVIHIKECEEHYGKSAKQIELLKL